MQIIPKNKRINVDFKYIYLESNTCSTHIEK